MDDPSDFPDTAVKQFFWILQVSQRAKSADKDVVDQLLTRQDDVIGELDKLEFEILEVIESLNAARQEHQLDPDKSTVDKSKTIIMPQPENGTKGTDDRGDQASRAA